MRSADLAPVDEPEAKFFRQMAWRADRWAIASESRRALELFAHAASNGELTFDEVVDAVENGRTEGLDPERLARLGRIAAVRPMDARYAQFALDALRAGVPHVEKIPATLPVRSLLFELLLWSDKPGEARQLLGDDAALQGLYFGYMAADLANPRIDPLAGSVEEWLDAFNRPFVHFGLSPLTPDVQAEIPFNTLNSMAVPPLFADTGSAPTEEMLTAAQRRLRDDDPTVSVIVTTFNPNPVELQTSVRSILRQTWRNLEVLLVDDASSEMESDLLDGLSGEDPRVRVIRQPRNGGTYLARNAGIRAATGQYITGQDTDDWSHPQRLERELLALHGRPDLAGVMVMANRTDDRLVRTAIGFTPQRRCEVSLMLRTEDARAMGGYVPMRKGADSEFRERLVAFTGLPVHELEDPLYVTRLSQGSLSRADFRHGWTAPQRLAFSSAYRYWHNHSKELMPPIDSTTHSDLPPFAAPERISGNVRPAGQSFDVCMVADWRSFGPLERTAVDEIGLMVEDGTSVAVLQLDSPYSEAASARLLQPRLQEWINQGAVAQIMPDEDVRVSIAIVRDPAAVEYARAARLGIDAGSVLVVADNTRAGDGALLCSYRPSGVDAAVRVLFGRDAEWMRIQGTSPSSAEFPLVGTGDEREYPTVLDAARERRRPARSGSNHPVIGRTALNITAEWPESAEDLARIYPPNAAYDVRVLGDARGGMRVLGERRMPTNWLDFRSSEISPEVFWATVDVAVQIGRRGPSPAVVRGLAEAMRAGVPVICGYEFRDILGPAAYYASPEEAPHAIRRVLGEARLRDELVAAGREFVKSRQARETYTRFIHMLLERSAEVMDS